MPDTPALTAKQQVPGFPANDTVIGLAAGPWNLADPGDWPREGYDGHLHGYARDWDNRRDVITESGSTKAEWLALADVMIARWIAWKAHVEAQP